MLEGSRIVTAFAEQNQRGRAVSDTSRHGFFQGTAQHERHRFDVEQPFAAPEFGQHLAQQAPALHRIGDAGRHPHVILQHQPATVAVTHDIEAGDLRAARARRWRVHPRRADREPYRPANWVRSRPSRFRARPINIRARRRRARRARWAVPPSRRLHSSPLKTRGTISIGNARASLASVGRKSTPASRVLRSRLAARADSSSMPRFDMTCSTAAWLGRACPSLSSASS